VTKCTVSGSRVFKVISIFRGDELCFVSRSRAPRQSTRILISVISYFPESINLVFQHGRYEVCQAPYLNQPMKNKNKGINVAISKLL
jgi:hypothetical protein